MAGKIYTQSKLSVNSKMQCFNREGMTAQKVARLTQQVVQRVGQVRCSEFVFLFPQRSQFFNKLSFGFLLIFHNF